MNEYHTKAYAKVNLGLDVTGRLPNGYHAVKMILQAVDIYDELTFTKAESGIELTSDVEGLSLGEDNLIYRAAKLMMEEYGIAEGVRIHLVKNIPIAAGMAGGSTDCAATLRGMNELFACGAGSEKLRELGVKLGADVPYCVEGGTALAEGIGEVLTKLPTPPDCTLLVAKPPIGVSTKFVYEHLDAKEEIAHPDIDGMVEAIRAGDLQGIIDRLGNVLESVTVEEHPVITRLKERMLSLGAAGTLMSGSGPTVFGIFRDEGEAQAAYEVMKAEGEAKQIYVTRFV